MRDPSFDQLHGNNHGLAMKSLKEKLISVARHIKNQWVETILKDVLHRYWSLRRGTIDLLVLIPSSGHLWGVKVFNGLDGLKGPLLVHVYTNHINNEKCMHHGFLAPHAYLCSTSLIKSNKLATFLQLWCTGKRVIMTPAVGRSEVSSFLHYVKVRTSSIQHFYM